VAMPGIATATVTRRLLTARGCPHPQIATTDAIARKRAIIPHCTVLRPIILPIPR